MQEDRRITYAVGDVHGMYGHLAALIDAIEKDAQANDAAPELIFLGDLIDGGVGSSDVVGLVDETIERYPGSSLILGNHDANFLACLRGEISEDHAEWWISNGFEATWRGYRAASNLEDVMSSAELAAVLRHHVNTKFPRHRALFEAARPYVLRAGYAFVHAGVKPGLPMNRQSSRDLMWIRNEFLNFEGSHDETVVHGHSITPSRLPEMHGNRIALDTGAMHTGRLSAGAFQESNEPYFLSAVYERGFQIERRTAAECMAPAPLTT